MKIFFCLNYFLPQSIGGTEFYTLRLVQYLKENKVEPVVLIPHFDHSLTSEYEYEGIRVIRYAENSNAGRKMIMGKKRPDGLKEFTRVIVNEKPDMVHFHELSPGRGINIFHVEKVNELNIPIVLTFHLSYYTCIKGSLIYKEREKCDGIIEIKKCIECSYQARKITGIKASILSATSRTLFKVGLNPTNLNSTTGTALGFPFVINKVKTDLLKLSAFAKKIVVLAKWYEEVLKKNGVPCSKLIYMKQGLSSGVQINYKAGNINLPLKVVYLGRISALKGLHLLIDAVCKISPVEISLYIYGPETEDDYAIECKQRAIKNKNIYWKGTILSELVIQTLSNYDVLCLPSAFEMSPLVIQEAFAAGLPVIASDVYGNAEQIKHAINGWMFRFNDKEDLIVLLNYLINNLDMIEKARLNLPLVTYFTEIAEKHLELYSDIVG